MRFMKIRNKKDWHFLVPGSVISLCGNASVKPYRYPKGVDEDNYCDIKDLTHIETEMQGNLCQACVREAYKRSMITVALK